MIDIMSLRGYFIWLAWIIICMSCVCCAPKDLREAQQVVAQADSMRAYGRVYEDSIHLAWAYTTLGRWKIICADEYVHACYHYGRLLREKDNPALAMQVFINATHSRSHDYHILGRVYSNMGSICHLASEYSLSYDMYERSAELCLLNRDTLLYCYNLNNMAFEKAMLTDKESAFSLIYTIEDMTDDYQVLSKTDETKAELYLKCKQFDTSLYYSQKIYFLEKNTADALLVAQSFYYLGEKDSATFYANIVLSNTQELYEINNALYILTANDDTKDKESIRKVAAERSDVQKLIEKQKSKLSQAVQLLEQDLTRKPDLWWLYSLLITLFFVGMGIVIYVFCKQKKQELLSQQIEELQQATCVIQEKQDILNEHYTKSHKQMVEEINHRCAILQDVDKMKKILAWKDYSKMSILVDKQFYLFTSKLQSKYPLNETEIRLCVLVLLDCGYEQIAELLFRSITSIGTLKLRVAKKLGTTSKQLRQYLIDNVCLK